MNRIVKKHYPVSRLPEDLRQGLPEDSWVDIVITRDDLDSEKVQLTSLVASGPNVHGTIGEVLAHLELLRDDR